MVVLVSPLLLATQCMLNITFNVKTRHERHGIAENVFDHGSLFWMFNRENGNKVESRRINRGEELGTSVLLNLE